MKVSSLVSYNMQTGPRYHGVTGCGEDMKWLDSKLWKFDAKMTVSQLA